MAALSQLTWSPVFGAGGGLLEAAAGAVVVLARDIRALLGGKDEVSELDMPGVDSAGTVILVEPEEAGGTSVETEESSLPGGGAVAVASDAGGAESIDVPGVLAEERVVVIPGGVGSTGVVTGTGGVADVGGGDSSAVVPGLGRVREAGGVDSQMVTITVVVTVLSLSRKSEY
jgi:hypothetical protein